MKLNYKRTFFVGLAFLSISSFWQMYDNIIPLILQNTFHLNEVIIGAMTETRYYPLMTQPIRPTMPTVEPYKPTITWKSEVETGQMEAV